MSSALLFDVAGRVLEPIAVIAGLEDMAMMCKPVQQCRGEVGFAEHRGPGRPKCAIAGSGGG